MKVYLSNGFYPITSSVYSSYMNKKYGLYNWDKSSTLFEHRLETLESLLDRFYNVTINKLIPKKSINYVKIDKYDTWSIDSTLANIILPMLKQLKATKHGSPLVDDVDVPLELHNKHLEEFNSWSDDPEEVAKVEERDRLLHAKWDWVMEEMIFAFTMKLRDNWREDYYKYEHLEESDPEYGNHLMGLKLVWEDREGQAATQDRISKGFILFGKYFECLWD